MIEFIKEHKKKVVINLIILAVLIIACVLYVDYVKKHRIIKRTYVYGDKNQDISVTIKPRGLSSDTWIKDVDGDIYNACIYEAVIVNNTENPIEHWVLTINPEKLMYLNNAWCGKIEIVQKDKSQTLDLRNLEGVDIELDHKILAGDLFIPVKKGERFIYYPDGEVHEYPLESKVGDETKSVTIGFIIYYQGSDSYSFKDFSVDYEIARSLKNDILYRIINIAILLWVVILISIAVIDVKMDIAKKRFNRDAQIIEQSLTVLTQFIDAKDSYTKGHSIRVATYSEMLAKEIGFSEDACKNVYYIALMHDCGKMYVSDEVLKKTAKLTDEEFEEIKSHTTRGAQMLTDFTSLEGIADGAMYHHERYDGKGYPQGKVGEEIPLIGRIICVADSFDAMNSERCYRKALPASKIISEIEVNKGKQFDPRIAEAMLKLIREGKITFAVDDVKQNN
ncbi:MAG: HD-GYP domain-containing protein [Lachnospiraceae bacterium]|nr:HD-GYP domain-containing protein [Lachnospiraceae bacterium]